MPTCSEPKGRSQRGMLDKMYAKAAVAKAAEMSGGCKAAIDMTAKYAREREQYGNPIGGYQAIQHFMSNMLLAYDTCNNYLYRVACMIDEEEDFERDASALKAVANEAYRFVTRKAVKSMVASGRPGRRISHFSIAGLTRSQ